MNNAERDQNRVTTLIAVSSADGVTPVKLYADPVTHRLLVDVTGSGASPLTTKGDLYTFTTTNARLPLGTDGQVLVVDTSTPSGLKWQTAGAGTGDVVGPASSTDNAIARFDSTTGKIIQNSGVTISDTNVLTTAGLIDSSLTINQIVATNGSKQLITLDTATYPTLDQLAFVKGVTSAIQTQLDAKQATGNYITGLTGDATASGPGSVALTLATVNANVGTFGSATQATVFTVNAKGLITAASQTTITPAIGSITGLGTNVAAFLTTPSSANLASALTDKTGTGVAVFATSPTLVTPILGVATATSINKLLITAPAISATLTIADGKTATFSNTITFAGTDSTVMTFPTSSATIARTDAGQTFTGAQVFSSSVSANNFVSTSNTIQLSSASLARSGAHTLTLTTTGTTNVTFPTTGTLATLDGAETFSNKTLTAPKFADLGYIADANGNELIIFDTVTSAVNELTVANAAIGNSPTISATGSDTNININLVPKGTGIVKGTRHFFQVRLKDSTTNLATGTSIGGDFRISPTRAITIKAVGAYVDTAATGGTLLTIDINKAGTTILSTKITLDASEKTSTTAATQPVISDSAIAADAVITFDIDAVGNTTPGTGLVVWVEYEYA